MDASTYTLPRIHALLFAAAVLALAAAGIVYPPYSIAVVLAVVLGMFLLFSRPDLAFGLFFAIETLFSEDVLLTTEKLEVTIYRVNLPMIGMNAFELAFVFLILAALIQRQGRIAGTRLDFSVMFFGLAALIGYLTCIRLYGDPLRLFEPRRMLHFFLSYFLAVNLIRTKSSLQAFLSLFFFAVILKSLEGGYLYLLGEGLEIKWRIRAIFTGWEDSLTFVTYLLFLGVIVVGKYDFPFKRIYLIFSPVVFYTFLFSYKRAYYVAMAVGLLLLLGMQGWKAKMRMAAWLLLCGVLMAGLITVMGQWQAIGMRFESILNPTKESSANYRLIEWQNAYISIKRNPIFGIGLGGVMPMEIFLSRTNLLGVHNTYLWAAVKMGILGFFSYVLLHIAFLRRLMRQNGALHDLYLQAVSKGIACSFAAFAAAEMFAPMFAQMRTAAWLGVMMGIGMTLPVMDCKREMANDQIASKSPSTRLP